MLCYTYNVLIEQRSIMDKEKIKIFLDEMFQNPELFIQIHGISKAIDPKYMLIADLLSEEIEKLTTLICANLSSQQSSMLSSRF